MSVASAKIKYIRTSADKARPVMDLVKNKDVMTAQAILSMTNKAVATPILKAIKSAASNAKSQKNIEPEELYVSNITADGGPMMKRFKAQAMGRASTIRRRTAHITVQLERKETPKPAVKPLKAKEAKK